MFDRVESCVRLLDEEADGKIGDKGVDPVDPVGVHPHDALFGKFGPKCSVCIGRCGDLCVRHLSVMFFDTHRCGKFGHCILDAKGRGTRGQHHYPESKDHSGLMRQPSVRRDAKWI